VPEKDEAGQVERWLIERTNAPRSEEATVAGKPVTVASVSAAESRSGKPETVQEPRHTPTVTGRSSKPVTDSVGTGSLEAPESLPRGRGTAPPAEVECLTCGAAYTPPSDRPELLRCAACVALGRGLVTDREADQMRLLARLRVQAG